MSLNNLLSKTLGVRLIREKHLEDAGFYSQRNANDKLNEKAAQALHVMTTMNGKSLSTATRRKADEYAVEVLGDRNYAPWLYVYCAMRGEFVEGWMPENYYHLTVVPRIMKGLADITAMKSFSNLLLRTEALPDIAYSIDGLFYNRDHQVISRSQLVELTKPYDRVFVKGDGGGAGRQIQTLSSDQILNHPFPNDCAVQAPIHPHPFFDEFISGAVPTLRINTVKAPTGGIAVRGARLRFGRSGSAWLTSDKSVRVAILDEKGTLDDFGYTPEWRAWRAHPDSGVPFSGRAVPFFARATELCRDLHARLPHFAIIGWDVAVNREGKAELIEWNGGHCAISFQEGLDGPHFRDMEWERFARKH